MTNNKLTDEQQVADLLFERACPNYLACVLCGHNASHIGGGNYECSEGHTFSVSEKDLARFARIVPEGWIAVPAEPTGDMLARIKLSDAWTTEALTARYKDMLRAAPRAPYAPAELQQYRKVAQPLTDPERQELMKLRYEDGLPQQQWAQSMQHDPTFGGILPKL